jgi:hypothetical protein
MCGKPIGDQPYRPVTVWARFGQMFFEHEKCHVEKGGK